MGKGGGFKKSVFPKLFMETLTIMTKFYGNMVQAPEKRWHMKIIVTNTNFPGKTIMVAHVDLETEVWHGLKINVPTLIFFMRINVGLWRMIVPQTNRAI